MDRPGLDAATENQARFHLAISSHQWKGIAELPESDGRALHAGDRMTESTDGEEARRCEP